MASVEFNEVSGHYRIRFRYGGKPFKRSLKTSEEREALSILGRVEETIRLMERGRLDLPRDADPGVFILSDGKLNKKPTTEQGSTVRELITLYQKSVPKDSKAPTTLKTEETHVSHLLKHLRTSKLTQSVTPADMQTYIERRLRDNYRDKPIRSDTMKKEVAIRPAAPR